MVMPEKAMAPFVALSRSMTADIYRTRVSAAVRDYCSFPPGRGFSRRRRAQAGLVARDEGRARGRELRASGEAPAASATPAAPPLQRRAQLWEARPPHAGPQAARDTTKVGSYGRQTGSWLRHFP